MPATDGPDPQGVCQPEEADAREMRALRTEQRIARLSRRLLALERDEIDEGLSAALALAAREVGADRAQLISVRIKRDGAPGLERLTWAAPGVPPLPPEDDEAAMRSFRWMRTRLQAGEVIHIPRTETLPDEAAEERRGLLEHGNRSFLAIPLLARGRLTGSLDVRCVRRSRTWTPEEIESLQLFGEVLASVLRRREDEDELRESAGRFEAIAENLHVALTESSPNGRILYASPRMPELLGYPNDEAQKIPFEELIHPDDLADSLRAYEGGGGGAGEGVGGVFRARHKDGSWRYVEASGRSYETRSGDRRFVTLLRDVTDRHDRNVELKSRLQLESLISELSRSFLSTETSGIDDAIRSGLQQVASVGGADRSLLVSLPELRRDQPFFFEWSRDDRAAPTGSPSEIDALQYRGFSSRLLAGEVVSIPVVADMPASQARERDAMMEAGIRSYLLVPAVSRGSLMGILCLHCVREERHWSNNEITLLQLVADLFTSALRRKRNETALSESEARFRALADNSQDPICELSAQAQILYASPAFAQLAGTERGDLEGRNLFDLAHPEDRDLLAELTESALGDAVDEAVVFRTRHGDGHWLDIEMTARAFASALGDARLVVVLRDVSQRERDRRALERQVSGEQRVAELSRFFLDLEPSATQEATREKLAVAAELAGAERAWMFSLDPRGAEPRRRYDWVREGFESSAAALPERSDPFSWSIPGLTHGCELNVPSVADLPRDTERAAAERDDLERRGVRSTLVIPLLSGRESIGLMGFEVMSHEHTWSPEEVTLLRLVGEVFVSALRREQAEVELERSQNQLLQAQKMEAVGTLAGGIAHDFNNHLAVMLGNARFIADEIDARPDLGEAMTDLQRSAEHCSQLTRSLLAFSRQSPVAIQAIPVLDLLSAVSDLVRPLLPRSIHFDVDPGGPEHVVRADPTQLRQVLINLLVNARDAMPDGGRLRLSSRSREISTQSAWGLGLPGAGVYVELCVRDDGRGMSDDTQARIFEPFFTTKRMGEGTGLGLATAYGIIQQCRGSIAVESALGEGTTFRVLLPLSEDASGGLEAPSGVDPGSGSETLLLVEDEPGVRRLVARTLRRRGYHVLEAEDGIAALQVADEIGEPIDLLVSDLVMPRMGGAELAAKLQGERPDLRVLFLSGHAEPQDASPAAEVRGARYLQKPFDEEDLLREIRFQVER